MRILHTAHSYAPEITGVAEVVGQLSRRLVRRGHEVHVATGRPMHTLTEEILDGVHVHRFDVSGNIVNGVTGEADSYVRFVQSQHFDIIAMHCAHTWSTDLLLPYLADMPAGKVFVGHGFSQFKNPAYRRYFDDLARYLRYSDKIVGLSPLLEEKEFCHSHGLADLDIIPNGVDIENWNKPVTNVRQCWKIGDRPWVLSVSNHSPVKGHKIFFDVIRAVHKEYPKLLGSIIGGHYPAAKYSLGEIGVKGGCWYRCQIKAVMNSVVELRSEVSRNDVVSAVKEADAVLITSSREASPLVMLESMAAGTPWLSFDVGCARENVGGMIVNSPKEMCETLSNLLREPTMRHTLGQMGKQRVAAKHSWEKIVTDYEKLYKSILDVRR
jgi:glycosyltransferase involved in cell wall biosynthesis